MLSYLGIQGINRIKRKLSNFTFHWCPLSMLSSNWLISGSYCAMYSVIIQCNACTFHSLFVWLMMRSKSKPKIYLEIWSHPLILRKAFHGNHYSKLKTESQFINIFKYDWMLTLLWSTIYWSWMKCVQFYLISLFVWLAIFVVVCLITQIVKAPTEVAMRISIALESTLLA